MLFFPTRGRLTGVHPNSSLLGFSAALACPKFHPYERHRNPMLLYNQPTFIKSRSSQNITRINPGILLKEANLSRSVEVVVVVIIVVGVVVEVQFLAAV